MPLRAVRLAFVALLLAYLALPVSSEDLTKDNYKQIRDHILPKPEEETWREIPWRVTLWDAVIDANKEDKPILLYAMNGHPFGCT
jgi:hypothetical protein